jgi:hypothetical protein
LFVIAIVFFPPNLFFSSLTFSAHALEQLPQEPSDPRDAHVLSVLPLEAEKNVLFYGEDRLLVFRPDKIMDVLLSSGETLYECMGFVCLFLVLGFILLLYCLFEIRVSFVFGPSMSQFVLHLLRRSFSFMSRAS